MLIKQLLPCAHKETLLVAIFNEKSTFPGKTHEILEEKKIVFVTRHISINSCNNNFQFVD